MRKIIFAFVSIFALGGGLAGGQLMRPSDEAHAELVDGHDVSTASAPAQDEGVHAAAEHSVTPDPEHLPEYVKFSNQFVVPIIDQGQIASLIILSLSLEVAQGSTETVYAFEPKLRDMMLQLLFDHSNTGGFAGSFTDAENLVALRRNLLEVARKSLGAIVTDVLITDIVRQDA